MGITKEQLIKVLEINKILFDPEAHINDLRKLVKQNNIIVDFPDEEQKDNFPMPAIHIQKETETNPVEYQKRLEGAGYRVLSEEKIEQMTEEQAKRKEQKSQGNDLAMALIEQLAEMAAGRVDTKPKRRLAEYDMKHMDLLKRIEEDAKIDITISIERNPFMNNASIMPKRAVMKGNELLLRNGNPVIEDIVHAEINGISRTFSLGVDNGSRPSATVFDVPWTFAKVLAEKYGVVIRNPQTQEIYHPTQVPKVEQEDISYCRFAM